MRGELRRMVSSVQDLPAIPAVASKVMNAVQDERTSADDLRELLESDPSLSARVLKVANSSMYGVRGKVETLRHAITLLGFKQVECLVLAASLRDVFRTFGFSERRLWEHATMCGICAGRLATYGPIDVERDLAFTAGLLHDIGKVALSNIARPRYARVMERVDEEGVAYIVAERDEFGFDHAVLGAYVAEKWRLPEPLVHAIRHHHDHPSRYVDAAPEVVRLTALTSVTTRACTRLGLGRHEPIRSADPSLLPAWGLLGLTEADRDPVLDALSEEAKSAEGLFG